MKRSQRYLILLVLIPILSFGQESDFKVISNSLLIIDQLNTRAKEITTFHCDFKQQKYMSYLDAVVESKGKFMFKNQNQIRWEYTNPYQYLVVINNGKLSFKSQKQSEGAVPKENKLFDQLNSIVQSAFRGKLGQDNNFTATLLENNSSFRLKLTPKQSDMKKIFSEVNLYFNKTTSNITSVQIIEISEDYTTLVFENCLFNKSISDSSFEIN